MKYTNELKLYDYVRQIIDQLQKQEIKIQELNLKFSDQDVLIKITKNDKQYGFVLNTLLKNINYEFITRAIESL